MYKRLTLGIVILALTGVGVVSAQMDPIKAAIQYRQSVMKIVGWNIGPLAGMVKGKMAFDAAVFEKNAGRMATMLPMALEGFVDGSDTGDTRAKPEIWSNMDDVKEKLNNAVTEARKLAEVATGGDEAAIKAQFAATGKACGACHKKYRKKKK